MILIVTNRGDLTADWLILELERRAADFVRFNTEDYPTEARFTWTPRGGSVEVHGRELRFDEITAVWYRRPAAPVMPADLSPEQSVWAARESREALVGLWRSLDALWVNHPDCNRIAESKPGQLQVAPTVGLRTPSSLITNDGDAVRTFAGMHPLICKPLWDGRVPVDGDEKLFFTSPFDVNDASLASLGSEPYLFQERVEKAADIRVTVIGEEVFAVRIESQEEPETRTDWRRSVPGQLVQSVIELPSALADGCRRLCRHYRLHFGAIDLAETPNGEFVFFEINPNGQWAWLEQRTGVPLRAALADLLLAAVRA